MFFDRLGEADPLLYEMLNALKARIIHNKNGDCALFIPCTAIKKSTVQIQNKFATFNGVEWVFTKSR